jgi:hypothetical protein
LKGAPVGELRDHGRINIHTHGLNGGREQVACGDCVQSRCHHQSETHAANFLAHHFLSLQCVGNDVGKRPVIANRSGQDEVNTFVDAAIKYPTLNEAAFNRLFDAPRPPYGIDCPEMMFVTFASANLFVEINTEGGAVKRRLDIVHGQAIAREQDLNVISFD